MLGNLAVLLLLKLLQFWNELPEDVHSASSVTTVRKKLKLCWSVHGLINLILAHNCYILEFAYIQWVSTVKFQNRTEYIFKIKVVRSNWKITYNLKATAVCCDN